MNKLSQCHKKGNTESVYRQRRKMVNPLGIKINLCGKPVASYDKDWENTELEWIE